MQLLGQLVRQAEAASQQLAERLRSAGHAAEAATTRSSASSIDELILAAQSSVQEMAADSEEGSCITPQVTSRPSVVVLSGLTHQTWPPKPGLVGALPVTAHR